MISTSARSRIFAVVAAAAMAFAGAAHAAKARGPARAAAAPPPAASLVTVKLSSDDCGGDRISNPGLRSKIYAKNNSKTRFVLAKIRYDTKPGGLGFGLLDNTGAPVTEQYPQSREFRLSPGEQKSVGCATVYRAEGSDAYMRVPIEASLESAVYVDKGAAAPADPDPAQAGRLMIQALPDRTTCQSKKPGQLYLTNIHPNRKIAFTLSLVDRKGRPAGEQAVTLAPMSSERIGCSEPDNVNKTAERIVSATYVD